MQQLFSTENSHNQCDSVDTYYAVTPDGLVSKGDVGLMRRFIQLSDSAPGGEKLARRKLFDAASMSLALAKNDQPVHLQMYGWPVTVRIKGACHMPARLRCASAKDFHAHLKLREMWAGALNTKSGVLVSPQPSFIHLNRLLDISPVSLRSAVRHGVRLFERKDDTEWSWDIAKTETELCDSDVPCTFMMTAYVAWSVGQTAPTIKLNEVLKLQMRELVGGLLELRSVSVNSVSVGEPQVLHEAVTQGQALQMCSMLDHATDIGRSIGVVSEAVEPHGLTPSFRLVVDYYSDGGEDPDRSVEWRYTALWRHKDHLQDIERSLAKHASRQHTLPGCVWDPTRAESVH